MKNFIYNRLTKLLARGSVIAAIAFNPVSAEIVYDSQGFEPLTFIAEENLDGQAGPSLASDRWGQDDGASQAKITGINAIEGNQSVKITRDPSAAGDTRWGIVKPITPVEDQDVVEIFFDMRLVQRVYEYGPLFGIEAYDDQSGTPKLIGSLLVDASTGEMIYHEAGTGAFRGTGYFTDLVRHHHYRLRLDFANRTSSLFAEGTLIHVEGFVDETATAFSDAPLVTLAAGEPTESGAAYIDNYRIETTSSLLQEATYSGRAVVAKLAVSGISSAVGDTGPLPPEGGVRDASLLTVDEAGIIAGEIGHAVTIGQIDRTRSEASVAGLVVNAGGAVIEADFLMSEARAAWDTGGATSVHGESIIQGLTISGISVEVTGEPNQTFALPLGQVIVNETYVTETSIRVNALRVTAADGVDLVIASAEAGYESIEEPEVVGDDYVSGGGWIARPSGQKAVFGLSGGYQEGSLTGHLSFHDKESGMKVKGTGVTYFDFGATPTARRIEGTATINGVDGYTYVLEVADNDPVGSQDTFSIRLSNGYEARGSLGGGNIRLHLSEE